MRIGCGRTTFQRPVPTANMIVAGSRASFVSLAVYATATIGVRMTLSVRGRCSVCGQRRRVRHDGNIRIHYKRELESPMTRGEKCPGSELPPLKSGVDSVDYFCNTGCSGCADMIKYGI